MNSTTSNGSLRRGGHKTRSANVSSNVIQLPKFSSSKRNDQLALSLRQAQARRAAAAAQAAAGRRAVICLALCLLGMVAGAVVLVQEVGIQAVEVRRG